MARIEKNVYRDWNDGETMTSDQYEQEREIGRVAINDNNSRISSIEKGQVKNGVHPEVQSIWYPPTMPDTLRGNGTVPSGYNPDEHLDALIEPLKDYDPEYISSTNLGLDESGTYQIRRYDFTPENYEKTMIVTAMIHGNEYTGFYSLYQFLDTLVKNWEEHPQLAYIRKNVRLITVPIINMWGYANQKRQNVNGVDLNRNFDYRWDKHITGAGPGETYYKGEAPGDQTETQLMMNLYQEFSDAVSCLDFHTTTVTEPSEYILYHPRYLPHDAQMYAELTEALLKDGEKVVWATSALPTMMNWVTHTHVINSANVEFWNDPDGTKGIRSSFEMTRALTWYGNTVLQASKIETKGNVEVLKQPYVKFMRYDGNGTVTIPDTIYNSIDVVSGGLWRVKTPGLALVDMTVTFTTDVDATIGFIPLLYQPDAPDFSWEERKDNIEQEVKRTYKAGTHTVSLHGAIMAQVSTDDSTRTRELKLYLRGKRSTGTTTIDSFRARMTFLPSSGGERFEVYDATGNEADGINAMKRVYPEYL